MRVSLILFISFLSGMLTSLSIAQEPPTQTEVEDVLTDAQWEQLDASVERALAWLASQQDEDGSFPTHLDGQPAVTSLALMAFMAHGHRPGEGRYGEQLDKAVEFIIRCQKRSGLIALIAPDTLRVPRNVNRQRGNYAVYNHAFAALVLSEVYAINREQPNDLVESAVKKALTATFEMQDWPKPTRAKQDFGGWRYLHPVHYDPNESDLSVTGWQLMFLRSAKNAGFEVPKERTERAVAYVQRCFSAKFGTYVMFAEGAGRSRGMAGAGILAMAHAGKHRSREALASGEFILKESFQDYNDENHFNQEGWYNDRYHYGAFLCAQAMYQLGGESWKNFFPHLVDTLVANQHPEGSWQPESHFHDKRYGNAYTTALSVLALGAPNQLLPIFQR